MSLKKYPNTLRLPAKTEAQVDTLRLLAQPKEGQQQFKNKKQPELTENRIVRKSHNQGDKEEAPRPVGGAERTRSRVGAGGPSKVADCGTGQVRLQLADPAAPHSRTDKPGGTLGE